MGKSMTTVTKTALTTTTLTHHAREEQREQYLQPNETK